VRNEEEILGGREICVKVKEKEMRERDERKKRL
jgi:hypothetical protein